MFSVDLLMHKTACLDGVSTLEDIDQSLDKLVEIGIKITELLEAINKPPMLFKTPEEMGINKHELPLSGEKIELLRDALL